MMYLILIACLLTPLGCEETSSRLRDNGDDVVSSKPVVPGKTLSYLNKPIKGKVSQRGLYRLIRSGGIVKESRASTGKAIAKPVIQLVKSTERIPLIKGVQMHLQYRIWPLPDQPAYVELRRILKHPPMTLPDGSITSGSDYIIKAKVSVNQIIAYTGYGLDEDYEMVEGNWIFEIWHQDNKLIEQQFTTYWPDREELADLEPQLMPGMSHPPSQ